MANPAQLLEACRRAGVQLSVINGKLDVKFNGLLAPWFVTELREHELDLIALLKPISADTPPTGAHLAAILNRGWPE